MIDEIEMLRQSGHVVEAFSTDRRPFFESKPALQKYFPAYRDVRGTGVFGKPWQLYKAVHNAEAPKQFSLALDDFKPDLVHIHNLHYFLTPSVLEALTDRSIPVFAHAHDIRHFCPSGNYSEDQQFNGSCVSGNYLTCLRNKCKHNSYSQTAFGLLEHYLQSRRDQLSRIDQWLYPSEAIFRVLQRAGIAETKIKRLANFVDAEMLARGPSTQDEGYLLYFGRIIADKGLGDLIEAMKSLPDIELKIVGDGPDAARYRTELAQFQLRGELLNIEFLGAKSKSELMPLIARCRATVIPSRWYEPFGLTILESYAFAKPVIGTRAGAIPELIEPERTGVLAEADSPGDLANSINSVMMDADTARSMGQTGREMLEHRFTADKHRDQLINIYRGSLGLL